MNNIKLTSKQETLLNEIAVIVREEMQELEYYADCGVVIMFKIEKGDL